MSLILLKSGDDVQLINEFDLLDESLKNWDGVGLPKELDAPGRVLNGTLLYAPDRVGGFVFGYPNNQSEQFYEYLGRKLEEADEDFIEALDVTLQTLHICRVLTNEEYQALMQIKERVAV